MNARLLARNYVVLLLALFFFLLPSAQVSAANAAGDGFPLRLEATIPLPQVQGRIDHLAVDLAGGRFFIAALGNNSLEIVDLRAGKHLKSIQGLHEPQGVLYIPQPNRLFVTNGGDGSCQIYDGNSLNLLDAVKFAGDADNLRYAPQAGEVYVGYGSGALGILDARTGKLLGNIPLAGHPESFQLEEPGPQIYVNVPHTRQIALVDGKTRTVTAVWPLPEARENYPMALDEAGHSLFVGCRRPSKIVVYDTGSGKVTARLDIAGDVDDLFFDANSGRLFASCGAGFLEVFQQTGPGHYVLKTRLATAKGARTSLFVPEQRRLYLAVPRRGSQPAEVRVYAVQP